MNDFDDFDQGLLIGFLIVILILFGIWAWQLGLAFQEAINAIGK